MSDLEINFLLFSLGTFIGCVYHIALVQMRKSDPLHGCELYKEQGCSNVDGMLCDFPKCSMLREYRLKELIK